MRAYRFRLSSVARIRAIEERIAREQLMLSLRDLRFAREMEVSAKAALVSLKSPTGVVAANDFKWNRDQAERLAASLRLCHENVVSAEERCAQARERWTEASKRSNVLEKLRQQGIDRWRQEALREEVAELDDMSSTRYAIGAAR